MGMGCEIYRPYFEGPNAFTDIVVFIEKKCRIIPCKCTVVGSMPLNSALGARNWLECV